MDEPQRIADQLRRAMEGPAWHGLPLDALLEDVTREQAAAHPIAGAHSIWEIALHLTAWHDTVTERLRGDPVVQPRVGDWPTVPETTDKMWRATREALSHSARRLGEAIAHATADQLDRRPPPSESTTYETCHGAVQHDLYRAGQIAVLKKALSAE